MPIIFWNKQQLKYCVKCGWLDSARTAFYNLLNAKLTYHDITAYLYSLEISEVKFCAFALIVNDRHFYKALFDYEALKYACKGYIIGKTQLVALAAKFSHSGANKIAIMAFDFLLDPQNDTEVAQCAGKFSTEILLQLRHAASVKVRLAAYIVLGCRRKAYLEYAVYDKDIAIRIMAIRKLNKAEHWIALFDDVSSSSEQVNEATDALVNLGECRALRQPPRLAKIILKYPYHGLRNSFAANTPSHLFEKERKAAEEIIIRKLRAYRFIDEETLWEAAAAHDCFIRLQDTARAELNERKESRICRNQEFLAEFDEFVRVKNIHSRK